MKNRLNTLLLASLLAISCIGCAARGTPAPSPAPKLQEYSKVPGEMVRVIDKNVVPPKQLANIESNAIGLMVDGKNRDWSKARNRLNLLKTEYNVLNPLLMVSAASKTLLAQMSNTINSLEKRVNDKNGYEVRMEANKLTKYVSDAQIMYKETIPSGVARMGYHSRQITLETEKGNWVKAKADSDSIASLWTGVKGKLNTTHSSDITKMSTTIDNLKKAVADKSLSNVKTYTKQLEDNLQIIKSDFQKQSGTK